MDPQIFLQAVDTLHSPTATTLQRTTANDWLVAFSAEAAAPSLCEAILRAPGTGEAALVFAANVVASSASQLGAAAATPLLQLSGRDNALNSSSTMKVPGIHEHCGHQ